MLPIFVVVKSKSAGTPEYLHQAPDAHKSYQGWQAPGFCRPTWILDRTFSDQSANEAPKEDRLYLKMQMDNSVRIIRPKRRLFEWRSTLQMKKTEKTEETGIATEEKPDNSVTKGKSKKLTPGSLEGDGTWWFKDTYLKSPAKFKLDMKEKDGAELLRYSCNFEFGKVDGYAVKFQEGTIYRFRGINKANGLPINPEEVGTFVLRANANRPIVSKEFQAIQN